MNGIFSVRIVYFDFYLLDIDDPKLYYSKDKLPKSKKIYHDIIKLKYCTFMERKIKQLPIIRIFGSTYRGQRSCINIHNYFPYFYVEIDIENLFTLNLINLKKFASLLEENVIRLIKDNNIIIKNVSMQIIHLIEIVHKIPFYGFHTNKKEFLKISVYDSKSIKPLVEILQSGVISNNIYQCYEAHLSLPIHFFADNNLFGMKLIKCTNFTFRIDIPEKIIFEKSDVTDYNKNICWKQPSDSCDNEDSFKFFLNEGIINEEFFIWDEHNFENSNNTPIFNCLIKSSKCALEIDVSVEDLINKQYLLNNNDDNQESKNECNKIVNLKNLNTHIKHLKPLIEVWKEEIKRREEKKIDELTFEKISNQNFFKPVENLLIKSPISIIQRVKNNMTLFPWKRTHNDIKEKSIESLEYKFNDLVDCYKRFGNFYGIKRHMIFKSKRNNFFNYKKKSNNIENDECYNEINDANDILSCINTISVTNSQRKNIIKSIATNKSVKEYFLSSTETSSRSNSHEKLIKVSKFEDDSFSESYSLLKKKKVEEKVFNQMIINNSFCKVILFRKLFYLWYEHKFIKSLNRLDGVNYIFFSNKTDYDNFLKIKDKHQKNKFRLDTNPIFKNHNSLVNYLNEYTKIIFKPEIAPPKSILKRNALITKLRDKISLTNLKERNKIFYPAKSIQFINSFPSSKELYFKFQRMMKTKINVHLYDQKFLINRFKKTENCIRKSIPTSSRIYAKNEYSNEISPCTEIKNKTIIYELDSTNSKKRNIKSPNKKEKELLKNLREVYNLCIISIEIFSDTRENFVFDYEKDSINTIFIVIHDENAQLSLRNNYKYYKLILTTFQNKEISRRFNYSNFIFGPEFLDDLVEIIFVKDEILLFLNFIEVFKKYDPDFILGYETEVNSIASIVRRAEFLKIQMKQHISRINYSHHNSFNEDYYRSHLKKGTFETNKSIQDDSVEYKYLEQKFGKRVKIKGRIIINLWRLIEAEIKLTHYQIENIVFKILKIREPIISNEKLFLMYNSKHISENVYCFSYLLKRTEYNLKLIEELDLINRDVQFTQIYGIDYQSSLTRGSQYRVEALLCRLSKKLNYVLLSATRTQLKRQCPNTCIPLVMEPPKCFYFSPVVVLDFQSLYPSIMIAYNICYTTCIGKIANSLDEIKDEYKDNLFFKKFGVYKYFKSLEESLKDLKINEEIINNNILLSKFFNENIIISTNNIGFVKHNIIEGIVPTILKELLLTRIMIKNSMKKYNKSSTTYKILHNRQLGLKLLANVTYGYTAAGFSGRMPNSEIADSIVSLAKETLLTAINIAEKEFKGKVIYGDTDSIFVLFEGRTIKEAFKIGYQIAERVTNLNPQPIKLQFEKVYCPLVLVSKKHYAGYKYEDPDSAKNNLDSKGLELIRRDTCEIVTKICEKIIRDIFDNKDLSKVKNMLYKSFDKILTGKVIIKEFIFAKEVRFGTYRGTLPASAMIAEKRASKDKNNVPKYSERIPYLVIENSTSKLLKDQIISPEDYFIKKDIRINAKYYIEKQILPVVQRFLEPLDVNVDDWYSKYPRPKRNLFNLFFSSKVKNSKIFNLYNFFEIDKHKNENKTSNNNPFYSKKLEENKIEYIEKVFNNLSDNFRERSKNNFDDICKFCSSFSRFNIINDIEEPVPCINTQCKIFYEKMLLKSNVDY